MRLPVIALVLALAANTIAAQATTVEEPSLYSVRDFMRFLGVLDAIGDLREQAFPDSAIELRFYTVGWSFSGVQLRRNATGEWTARRIVIEGPRSARIEPLPPIRSATLDSVWQELVVEGLLTLPTEVPRTWSRLDGHSYSLELRRGSSYRSVRIDHMDKPEVPADVAIKRIAGVLKRQFPFVIVPER